MKWDDVKMFRNLEYADQGSCTECRLKIPACRTNQMRFEFRSEGEGMCLGKINFYGPKPEAAEGRSEIAADAIARSSDEKSHSGPFDDMCLEDSDLQNAIACGLNDNMNVKLDGSDRLEGVCKQIADGIYR